MSSPLLTFPELLSRFRIGHTYAFDLIRRGLPSLKVGRRRFFDEEAVAAWFEREFADADWSDTRPRTGRARKVETRGGAR